VVVQVEKHLTMTLEQAVVAVVDIELALVFL
jgi:hypothetical protein